MKHVWYTMLGVTLGAWTVVTNTAQRPLPSTRNQTVNQPLTEIQKEEARDKELQEVILANCIQMLGMLGSIALAPNNPPAAINVFIQTAQLILNVAQTIFKNPIPRAHQLEHKRALHAAQQNIYKIKMERL